MEIKANWFPVARPDDPARSGIPGFDGRPEEAARVHHVTVASDGQRYALVSMHIISKIVPNWTWATFEHRNNPGRCDEMGCRDKFGAQEAYVPPAARPGRPYADCAKTEALRAMFARANAKPVFENYCLKGTQTDFIDRTGVATLLGNSVTEAGFADRASCMTCHARSGFGPDGKRTSIAGFDVVGQVLVAPFGLINPAWFWAGLPERTGAPCQSAAASDPDRAIVDYVWSVPALRDRRHGRSAGDGIPPLRREVGQRLFRSRVSARPRSGRANATGPSSAR